MTSALTGPMALDDQHDITCAEKKTWPIVIKEHKWGDNCKDGICDNNTYKCDKVVSG